MPSLVLLEIAIGTVFVYLLLSLFVSAAAELVEALLKRRAGVLVKGIREMLSEPGGAATNQQKTDRWLSGLYSHVLIRSLYKGLGEKTTVADWKAQFQQRLPDPLPSYIPARLFALALIDMVFVEHEAAQQTRASAAMSQPLGEAASSEQLPAGQVLGGASIPPLLGAPRTTTDFRTALASIDNAALREALRPLLDEVSEQAGLVELRKQIEFWYDSTMERVSGWYKRRTQWIIFSIGLVAAGLINADTFAIVRGLQSDSSLRAALVHQAEVYAEASAAADTSGATQSSTPAGSEVCPEDSASPECKFERSLDALSALGPAIGWDSSGPRAIPDSPWAWVFKALGWLVTACAISLGAPFWFDLLNKFMSFRASLKPKESQTSG